MLSKMPCVLTTAVAPVFIAGPSGCRGCRGDLGGKCKPPIVFRNLTAGPLLYCTRQSAVPLALHTESPPWDQGGCCPLLYNSGPSRGRGRLGQVWGVRLSLG